MPWLETSGDYLPMHVATQQRTGFRCQRSGGCLAGGAGAVPKNLMRIAIEVVGKDDLCEKEGSITQRWLDDWTKDWKYLKVSDGLLS